MILQHYAGLRYIGLKQFDLCKFKNMTIWSNNIGVKNKHLLSHFGYILVGSFINLDLYLSGFVSFSENFSEVLKHD